MFCCEIWIKLRKYKKRFVLNVLKRNGKTIILFLVYIVLTVLVTSSEAKYGVLFEQFWATHYFYDGKLTDDGTTAKEDVQDTLTNLSLLKNEDLLPSNLYQPKSRCSEI